MNPLAVEALGAIVRAVLQIGAGWLVGHGVWTAAQSEKYVEAMSLAGAMAILSLGWSFWQKHRMRSKLVTALALPAGSTEEQVQAMVQSPHIDTPPVTVPKDVAPYMPSSRP